MFIDPSTYRLRDFYFVALLHCMLSYRFLQRKRKVRTAQSNVPVKSRVFRKEQQKVPQKITARCKAG